jgi:hypothetical protein
MSFLLFALGLAVPAIDGVVTGTDPRQGIMAAPNQTLETPHDADGVSAACRAFRLDRTLTGSARKAAEIQRRRCEQESAGRQSPSP